MYTKKLLEQDEYKFIHENKHLKNKIILLGLSGSISYGTNNEQSDIDLRGITLNSKSDLIGLTSFEQYVDNKTDTCIYGFNKMMKLLIQCNPNTIELLGLNEEHYLYLSEIGKELIDNRRMFLSKRAIQSFGGYASAQLRRLQNAMTRDALSQTEKEEHILNSIHHAMYELQNRYHKLQKEEIQLYLDTSESDMLDKEIFMDIQLQHYPLRDYTGLWSEMNSIVKSYDKLGKRNKKKDDNHLNKHAMHLIRLFMMAIDILEKQEINTYRSEELELLLSIRNGEFQKSDGIYRKEFYEILEAYEHKLEEAGRKTSLPDEPDMVKIEQYIMDVNERVIRDEI